MYSVYVREGGDIGISPDTGGANKAIHRTSGGPTLQSMVIIAHSKSIHFLTMLSRQYIVKPNFLPANLAAVSANLSLSVDACRLVNPAITSPSWEDRAAITSRRHAASIVAPASEETVSHRHTTALAAAF